MMDNRMPDPGNGLIFMPNKEYEPRRESEQSEPYLRAARYSSDQNALSAYTKIQARLFGSDWDLSAYRVKYADVPHVVVLGASPPPQADQEITAMLAAGSPATLPADVITYLIQRRAQAQRIGPWVERHWRPIPPN